MHKSVDKCIKPIILNTTLSVHPIHNLKNNKVTDAFLRVQSKTIMATRLLSSKFLVYLLFGTPYTFDKDNVAFTSFKRKTVGTPKHKQLT